MAGSHRDRFGLSMFARSVFWSPERFGRIAMVSFTFVGGRDPEPVTFAAIVGVDC